MANPQFKLSGRSIQRKPIKVITEMVRFSYVNIFVPLPSHDEGKLGKFSLALIIPKDAQVTVERMQQAIEQCKQEHKDVWGGIIPQDLRGGLRDGDLEKNDPAYDGCWFINATSAVQPGIVDENLQPITDPYAVYSGCYGRASISFYAYNNPYVGMGLGCTLLNVQKLKDGERLGTFGTPELDFKHSSASTDFGARPASTPAKTITARTITKVNSANS